MSNFSRRQLANYAVDSMLGNVPAADLSARLAAALVVSGREKEIDLLFSDIDQELEERGLQVQAKITSAHPLSAQLKNVLAKEVQKITKAKEVILQEQVDRSVIGGIKVETPTRSWDKTIKRTLTELKESV